MRSAGSRVHDAGLRLGRRRRDLVGALFPAQRGVNCYELYALYVGAVPARTVLALNQKLVTQLRSSRAPPGPSRSGLLRGFGP
jgi:hypothetical protein